MATITWVSAASTDWDISANWSPAAPGSGDSVAIALPGSYDITIGATEAVTVESLDLTEAELTVIGALTLDDATATSIIGPSATLQGMASHNGTWTVYDDGSLLNQGTIALSGSGAFMTNYANSLANTGAVIAAPGAQILLESPNLANLSAGTLTGGTYIAGGAGAVIDLHSDLPVSSTLAADDAVITLSGAGSEVFGYQYNAGSRSYTAENLENTLGTISTGGVLNLLGGRDYPATVPLTVDGVLALGGGSLSAPGLLVAGGGTIAGFGTIGSVVNGTGVIAAQGGTLDLPGGITGNATLMVSGGATAELSGRMAGTLVNQGTVAVDGTWCDITGTVSGSGGFSIGGGSAGSVSTLELGAAIAGTISFGGGDAVLTLDRPGSSTGTISGFGAGDTVDLAGIVANGVNWVGTTLDLTENGSLVDALTLTGLRSGLTFTLASDGAGGTELVGAGPASALPPISDLLSGYGFNDSPAGTALALTYYFETSAPTAGTWAKDPTWTALSAAEQTYVQQALANISAFANVTFTQAYQTADINYGNSTSQSLMGTNFGETQDPTAENPIAYTAFNGADFSPTPDYPDADNEYLATHELGNALGLVDYYGTANPWTIPAQYTNSNYSTMAGVTFNTSVNAPPNYENPVGFQLLDIAALQYFYGVNETGYTPSYQNTTATLSGSALTYSLTNASAAETIWVGSNVASVKCLDFSACTASITVNLNAGTFSSTYVGPAMDPGYAAGANDAIAIALNTVFNVGIADRQASSLIADSTPGNNDVLVGGSGNDSFTAGGGQDIFIGGGGTDTAIFHDAAADYKLQSLGAGVMVVTDDAAVPADGTIVLDGSFTSLQFADRTVAEAANVAPSGSTDMVSAPAAILTADQGALAYLVGAGKISVAAACYCRGTRIRSECGDVAIEDLAIGDRLVTASGALRPIKWIGKRSYAGRFLRTNPQLWPIVIRAGALAEQIPARDLFVSPLHAMFLDGILIPAENLVNGESIARVETSERVDYFHIELESHDVILAEGAGSETFIDDDNRSMFHNADSYAERYRPAERPPALSYAPRMTRGYEVHAIHNRVAMRAGQLYGGPIKAMKQAFLF